MKFISFFPLLLFCACGSSSMQKAEEQSIDGTWLESNSRDETLRIYYKSYSFFISWSCPGDSFLVAGVGSYKITENRLVERMLYSTWADSKVVSSSRFRVHGDTLFRDGVDSVEGRQLMRIKQVSIRVPADTVYTGANVGLWYRIDTGKFYEKNGSGYIGKDTTSYQLVTPTHWFRMGMLNNNQFHAMSGLYTMKHDTLIGTISYSSLPIQHAKFNITQSKDQLPYWFGDITDSTGRKLFHFQDTSMLRIAGS